MQIEWSLHCSRRRASTNAPCHPAADFTRTSPADKLTQVNVQQGVMIRTTQEASRVSRPRSAVGAWPNRVVRRAGGVGASRGAAGREVFLPGRVRIPAIGLRPSIVRLAVRAVTFAAAVIGRIGMARSVELIMPDVEPAARVGRGDGDRAVGREDEDGHSQLAHFIRRSSFRSTTLP